MFTRRILLLGTPRVERDGALVTIERRKSVGLLAYLAVTKQTVSRERLAALFWPDAEPSSAFAYLRTTLWALNKALGEDWALTEPGAVAFNRDANLWLDVEHFTALTLQPAPDYHAQENALRAYSESLRQAAALYRDDFMAGFSIPDSAEFEEWQFFQREAIRRDFARLLERLVMASIRLQDYEIGISAARRWVALDTLHEPAHRALMQLYAWSGQHAAAIRQYQEVARLLEAELGVTPEAETTTLYETIQGRRLSAPVLDHQLLAVGEGNVTPNPPPPARAQPTAEAAAKRLTQEVQHIPHENTPFIGREADLAEIARLFADPNCRLLTLLGPGGIGKTRLAMAAAEATTRNEQFADGVYFVSLVGVYSPDFLAIKILEALTPPQDGSAKAQLLAYLRNKSLLLVLDNFEHLLAGADLLSEMLLIAPHLKLLVTSRERLNLREEWLYETPGLPYPTTVDAQITHYDAVQLFIQSARRARPDFTLTSENAAAVVQICALVHGMPLGIELAATWVQILTCQEIAREIRANLDFLSTTVRNMPERHRSLRAVFDTSWGQLVPDEQRVLSHLSVFRAGFRADAAREVAQASPHILLALVSKSLLSRNGHFTMHELLRQFAEGKLTEQEREAIRARHCDYFAAYLAEQGNLLKDSRQRQGLDAIQAVMDDLRSAWYYAVEHRRCEALRQMWRPLHAYHSARGPTSEYAEMLRCAVEAFDDPQTDDERLLLASVLAALARRLYWMGQTNESQQCAERALTLLEAFDDHPDTAFPLALIASLRLQADRPMSEADALLRRALAIFEASGDRFGVAYVYARIGANLQNHVRYSEAYEFFQRALAIYRELGNPGGQASVLGWLYENVFTYGDYETASTYLQQQIPLLEAIGDHIRLIYSVNSVSKLHDAEATDYDQVIVNLQSVLEINRKAGQRRDIAWTQYNIAHILWMHTRYDEALAYYTDSLRLFREMNDIEGTTWTLNFMALCYLGQGELETAARHVHEALEILETVAFPWSKSGALYVLGDIELARGNFDASRQHFLDSIHIAYDVQSIMQVIRHLGGLADLFVAAGDHARGIQLATFVQQHPASDVMTKQRARRTLNLAAGLLPAETLTEARAFAHTLTLETALDFFATP